MNLKLRAFLCLISVSLLFCGKLVAQTPQFAVPVTINPDKSITYNPTPKGDRIPDFYTVGYNYGNTPRLPAVYLKLLKDLTRF